MAGAAARHALVVASMPNWNFLQYPAWQAAAVARDIPRLRTAGLPYLLICTVARLGRQPRLLLPGFCFSLIRMLDAAISPYSVPAAWWSVSSGRWKNPAHRPVGRAATALLSAAGEPAGSPYRPGTSDEPGVPARVAEASHVSG